MIKNVGDFVRVLEREGELVRVKEPVSRDLEITEITDRVSKRPDGGKALLFENVKGASMPVLINAFGSRRRMALALGRSRVGAIPAEIGKLLDVKRGPPSLGGK